ncbi:hypothetical protein DERP_009946 [Dermatophagoides pteronyssinus]|uniref:Transmembrane protein n=1 Tax=Dermatophagoides pteronyssinus TaxID=6956 RepID=A0ABQ8J224_DERPT|nr:hypothetical protein DERP_009946 [Dermatophagoides pteronyssinus]
MIIIKRFCMNIDSDSKIGNNVNDKHEFLLLMLSSSPMLLLMIIIGKKEEEEETFSIVTFVDVDKDSVVVVVDFVCLRRLYQN